MHAGAVHRDSGPHAAALPDRRLAASAPHLQPSRLLHVNSSVSFTRLRLHKQMRTDWLTCSKHIRPDNFLHQ